MEEGYLKIIISTTELLFAILLVGAVEGSHLQQLSQENLPPLGNQNTRRANPQRLLPISSSNHHMGSDDTILNIPVFFPRQNPVYFDNGVIRSDLNVVMGKPVNGGANDPFSSKPITIQPVHNEKRSPFSVNNVIRSTLSVAAAKVNDTDFLNAIPSIEDHIERTVLGSKRTSKIPTTRSSPSLMNTAFRSSLSQPDFSGSLTKSQENHPRQSIGKIPSSPNTEINQIIANILDSNSSRKVFSARPKSLNNNYGQLPFNSIAQSTNEGRRKIIIIPTSLNLNALESSFPQFNFQNLRQAKLIGSTTLGNKTIEEVSATPSKTTFLKNKSTPKTSTQSNRQPVKQSSNQTPRNITQSRNNLIDRISTKQIQSDHFSPNNNHFSTQSEHFQPSQFHFTEDTFFSGNPFTQSEKQINSFTPSVYPGPQQIAQFINSVQPKINSDQDFEIIRPSQINPIGINHNFFRRPTSQPLHLEELSNTKTSRFIDDVQLSHIQPNPEIFPEVRQLRFIPELRFNRGASASSNNVVSRRFKRNPFGLSGFGTLQPGLSLAAFDHQIMLEN